MSKQKSYDMDFKLQVAQQRMLGWDSHRCHTTDPVEDAVLESNSVSVIVPGGCTKILQPADVSWNAPFKSAYRLQ